MACNDRNSTDAKCIKYTGGTLSCSGIQKNDALDVILSKLDDAICNSGGGSGTLSSVGISSTDLVVTNSPLTSNGSIGLSIANRAVSYAKIQDVTGKRIIGRYSPVSGLAQEITIGTGLDLSDAGILSSTGGTVTSVGLVSSDITISGSSPITTSGTWSLSLPIINSNVGTFNNITANAKGQVIAASNVAYLTANQSITLSGDVSGTGTTAITTTIGAGAVTYSKIQNVAASSILGNPTGISASVSEITLGTGLSFSGSALTTPADTTNQKVGVYTDGSLTGIRKSINFISGTNVIISSVDNSVDNRVDVTITSSGAGGSGTWGFITGTLSDQTDLQAALDAKQPLDSDLTTIAGLTPTTDNIIQSVSGAWASRTPAQLKTTLALTKTDVGLSNVPNTDATNASNISSGTLNALRLPAFSGDISTTAGSSVTTIANDAVTYAKIQNISASRLVGRYSASSGDMQEITVGAGLTLSTGGVLSANTSGTVTSVGISSTDLTVTGSPITGSGTITLGIPSNSITVAKFQQVATQTILGRYSAGTGNVQTITIGSGLALDAGTGVLYATGGGGGGGSCFDTLSVFAGSPNTTINGTNYISLNGDSFSTNVSDKVVVIPTSGYLKNLFVIASGTQGASTITFTLMKGATIAGLANTALSFSVAASTAAGSGTVYSDTSNSVAVNAGDIIVVKAASSSTSFKILGISMLLTNQ